MSPRPVLMTIPRSAGLQIVPNLPKKETWREGMQPYNSAAIVLPWLQTAFGAAMNANPNWGKSGIPVGFVGPYFIIPEIKGTFQVVGASEHHGPYIVWYSAWSAVRWSMYLDTVRTVYKGTKPIKGG